MAQNKTTNSTKPIETEPIETELTEPIEEPVSETNSVVERVISKVKQVIQIKKVLSERQQSHLDKLAAARMGKKSTFKEIPVETIPAKVRKPRTKKEPVVVEQAPVERVSVKVRAPRAKKLVEPEPVEAFKTPVKARKAPIQKTPLPPVFVSSFTRKLF